ncbi:uncharacterized protein LOC107805966 [Nicotiana tabacum]|uniref:Uncharacterized protein LOC107805966 n=2 Tax=Nicotiana TaxID=4085 RepID=A0A1S4B9G9_TOBAC|nr:PREDICTED: uncharacterized protein LOC104239849 [Nicotiana sylvestris]XP_009792875.1 PREDICTED: uncharacterized protein LOC104239849 [Nicotiana sylvestris]XP_016485570.1 PREDICTED: uncharacterized protein LOC107805966 [Nicotiana tabacum]
MATAPVKSQPLHYFSLPQLKWGQKSHTNTNHRFRRRESPSSTADNHLSPLQPADLNGGSDSDKLPVEEQRQEKHVEEEEGLKEEKVLWNLRPRKSVMKVGLEAETAPLKKNVEMEVESSNHIRSQRVRDNNVDNGHGFGSGKKEKKKKLWISLSREEIEEDVYSMTGSRPARRPKRRSKTIQKQLDNVFPGMYLVGLTADSFRVNDTTK